MSLEQVETNSYSNFQRYLAAKKSVDDRALNQHVWDTLHILLQETVAKTDRSLKVVEIGGGIGTMLERLLARDLLTDATYTVVDASAENIAEAKVRLPAWSADAGFDVQWDGATLRIDRAVTATRPAVTLRVDLIQADCFLFAAQPAEQGRADLLIAHALLDLFALPAALSKLCLLLRPSGMIYTTINFDGNTILQPEIERTFDDQIEAAYHATMDARITDGLPSGDSRTGRHLFGHLQDAGLTILAAGSSDWVVFGGATGYPVDEAYFLHFIIETMAGALASDPSLDQAYFGQWIQKRHAQIERGVLVYIAHQLDFLAQLG